MRQINKKYCDILGLTDSDLNLSDDEFKKVLRKKYRKLCLKYHPDKCTDASKKEEYETKFKEINEAYQAVSEGKGQEDFFSFNTGGMGDFGEWMGMGAHNDMFSSFFNMNNFGFSGNNIKRTIQVPAYATLKECYYGAEKSISVMGEDVKFNIPKGSWDNMQLKINYKNDNTEVYVVIKVTDDSVFQRKKDDLYVDINISAIDAMLGGKEKITDIKGESITFNIPKGIKDGMLLRFPGRGMPIFRQTNFGDMYATIHLTVPSELNKKEIELLTKLKKQDHFK